MGINFCYYVCYSSQDKQISPAISCSPIMQPDGLFYNFLYLKNKVFIMLVNGEPLYERCPVVGSFEETGWNMQCPVSNQWSRPPVNNLCNYDVYNGYSDLAVQCYTRNCYVQDNPPQYYQQRVAYQPPSFQSELPCRQSQEWDYTSMCYNVDGRPCQYTNVVDLEDFM